MDKIILSSQDCDKVLKVLRNQYQQVLENKKEREYALEKYNKRTEAPRMMEMLSELEERASKDGYKDIGGQFKEHIVQELAEYDAKLKEIEYAIMVMTMGTSGLN